MQPGRSKRRWFQFSLRTLLLLITLAAVFLAGYRSGYRQGYFTATQHYGVEIPGVWDASDLVIPLPDAWKPPDDNNAARHGRSH